jgi:hypothetical protein
VATFTAIVTAHADEAAMLRTINSLLAQTRVPNEIIVLASDISLSEAERAYPAIRFHPEPNLSDWGHDKRAKGLDLAASDYSGWFNHDDSYDKTYIEVMMSEAEAGHDAVYCGWSKASTPNFRLGSSTSGNYIVSTALAREAGYTDRHYEADGTFIDKIASKAKSVKFVPKVLYFHNEVRNG